MVNAAIRSGRPVMDRKWHGHFLAMPTFLVLRCAAVRPCDIERDMVSPQSPACRGLYPVGEGAGHSGGIVSAAVDGLMSAKQIVRQFAPCG